MDDTRPVIIDVDNLTKDYGYGRGVFDVSIKVHQGECYGYLGPNGAGKSTTIRHIMGFSKPQKGTIKVFGFDSFGNTDKILGRVGYLPGEVALPLGLDGWGFLHMMENMRGSKNKERLDYLLKLFRLDPSGDMKRKSLGEKRKLAVVAAFMDDPDVLVLDEPTSGLDPVMQHVFIDFVKEEKERGKTILLSSHIFSEVDATCDIISIIKDGHHISTFDAHKIKHDRDKSFTIRVSSKSDFEKALAQKSFAVTGSDPAKLSITFGVGLNDTNKFLSFLKDYGVTDFRESKFSLEDYFMGFYKEDRKFSGLKGIEGNPKDKESQPNGK